jgi:hypothetical protein
MQYQRWRLLANRVMRLSILVSTWARDGRFDKVGCIKQSLASSLLCACRGIRGEQVGSCVDISAYVLESVVRDLFGEQRTASV